MSSPNQEPDDLRLDEWPESRAESASMPHVLHRRRPSFSAPDERRAERSRAGDLGVERTPDDLSGAISAIEDRLGGLGNQLEDLGKVMEDRLAQLADIAHRGRTELATDVAGALGQVADRLERLVARQEDVERSVENVAASLRALSGRIELQQPQQGPAKGQLTSRQVAEPSYLPEEGDRVPNAGAIAEQVSVLAFEVAALRRRVWGLSMAPAVDDAAVEAIVDRLVRRLRQGT